MRRAGALRNPLRPLGRKPGAIPCGPGRSTGSNPLRQRRSTGSNPLRQRRNTGSNPARSRRRTKGVITCGPGQVHSHYLPVTGKTLTRYGQPSPSKPSQKHLGGTSSPIRRPQLAPLLPVTCSPLSQPASLLQLRATPAPIFFNALHKTKAVSPPCAIPHGP